MIFYDNEANDNSVKSTYIFLKSRQVILDKNKLIYRILEKFNCEVTRRTEFKLVEEFLCLLDKFRVKNSQSERNLYSFYDENFKRKKCLLCR